MQISFDYEKRAWTLRERGLDFAEAAAIFSGPLYTAEDVRFAYPERRYQTYGWLDRRMVLLAWTPTVDGIRIISMRYCHDKEQERVTPRMG